jgi:hypothetical protein
MTALPLRPVGHEDRLTLTGHLSELRTRLVVCAVTLGRGHVGRDGGERTVEHVQQRPALP